MAAPEVLQKAFKLLPADFKIAYKKANYHLNYAVSPPKADVFKITLKGIDLEFNVYYLDHVSHLQLNYIERDVKHTKEEQNLPTLVISKIIYPKIAAKLIEMGINYIDATGNLYINEKNVYILITGKKTTVNTIHTKSRLFGETGIKLLFVLLQDEEAAHLSYRELADAVQISPASISILYKEMIRNGYLLEEEGVHKRLLRKRELLQRWVNGFREVLRPKLVIGSYQSLKKDFVRNYATLPIDEWSGSWGGEPAAAIYTNYLIPETLTLFIPKDEKGWMKKMGLVPVNDNQDIDILRYFWDINNPLFKIRANVVPPLLAYAELAASEDSRNLETAQKIYDEYLQFIER